MLSMLNAVDYLIATPMDCLFRVGKMQGRLLAQMEANVDKLAKSAKQTVKKLGDAIWGKGDGKG